MSAVPPEPITVADIPRMELEPPAEAASVRPYVVTGGRVGQHNEELPVETLVTATAGPIGPDGPVDIPEQRTVLALATDQYLSIMEISAYSRLPLGVVRVLVSDLADAGRLELHASRPANGSGARADAPSLSVLESVLDGISVL